MRSKDPFSNGSWRSFAVNDGVDRRREVLSDPLDLGADRCRNPRSRPLGLPSASAEGCAGIRIRSRMRRLRERPILRQVPEQIRSLRTAHRIEDL